MRNRRRRRRLLYRPVPAGQGPPVLGRRTMEGQDAHGRHRRKQRRGLLDSHLNPGRDVPGNGLLSAKVQ